MRVMRAMAIGVTLAIGASVCAGPGEWGEPVQAKGEAVPTTAGPAAAHALKAGDRVPEVSFKDGEGHTVSLASQLESGPLVLIFYRGGWCPYCVGQLKAFEKDRSRIEAAGGRLIAVSTEIPQYLQSTKTKAKLGYPLFSDPGAVTARAFGVAWSNARYAKPLAKYQGNDKGEIPLGVTYIIDSDGVIRGAFLEDDYKKRATPDQVIEALSKID